MARRMQFTGHAFAQGMFLAVFGLLLSMSKQSTNFFSGTPHGLTWRDLPNEVQARRLRMREPADNLEWRSYLHYMALPAAVKETLSATYHQEMVQAFHVFIEDGPAISDMDLPSKSDFDDLAHACRHALGNDIRLEILGSHARGLSTLLNHDIDIQVTRKNGSERSHVFTMADKLQVANTLKKVPSIERLEIGNVAIKFYLAGTPVDLVLFRERPEEFPRLRGGSSFFQNSRRIHGFLDETPAARSAIIGLKTFCFRNRPKGILLEAIACRLATLGTCPITSAGPVPVREHLEFFFAFVQALRQWETCPAFANDLKQDLSKLPDKKREEYVSGLERVQRFATHDEIQFRLLNTVASLRGMRDAMCHGVDPLSSECLIYHEKHAREVFAF